MPRFPKKALGNPLIDPVPCPPAAPATFVRLLYPREGQPVDVVAVGDKIHGVLSHFCDGQPVPHYPDESACPGCRLGARPRWYGYLACIQVKDNRRRLLVITEGAYRNCPGLRARDGSLRGFRVGLQRMGRGRNAPVKAQISAAPVNMALPLDWSVPDNLALLWRIAGPDPRQAGEECPDNPFQSRKDAPGRDGKAVGDA